MAAPPGSSSRVVSVPQSPLGDPQLEQERAVELVHRRMDGDLGKIYSQNSQLAFLQLSVSLRVERNTAVQSLPVVVFLKEVERLFFSLSERF